MSDVTITKSSVFKEDLSLATGGTGAAETGTRKTSTGADVTLTKLDASHLKFRTLALSLDDLVDGGKDVHLKPSAISMNGVLTNAAMSSAGYVKNNASGVLSGGNSIAAADLPAATATAQGAVELATNAETLTGTDATRATTPAGVASLRNVANGIAGLGAGGLVAPDQLGGAGSDGTKFLSQDQTYKAPTLTNTSNYLTSNVTLTNADTWYDGPTLNLTAGTYLLIGHLMVAAASATTYASAKLWNGTTVKSTTSNEVVTANYEVPLPISAIVTLTGAETWKISACLHFAGGGTIMATPVYNSTGCTNTASYLIAIRIA